MRPHVANGAAPPLGPPTAATYGWLAAGAAAFIVYGSLVPFDFRSRQWDEVVDSFVYAMRRRVAIESRADGAANFLLGVPLGFGLLGMVAIDRPAQRALIGLALLPFCTLLAMAVEFAQLYVPERTCAGSDVLMQTAGAAAGMMGWVLLGRWLTDHARGVWAGPRLGGAAGRVLVVYLALLVFVLTLPLDLNPSPRDLYKKLRDRVWFVPFREFGAADADGWKRSRDLLEVTALYLPVGLLAGRLPGRFWRSAGSAAGVLAVAVGLAASLEGVQLFVESRSPSGTDAVVGGGAAFLGWALARGVLPTGRAVAALAGGWAAVLVAANWQPFDFLHHAHAAGGRPGGAEWLPFLALEARQPLFALQDLMSKTALFAPLGVLLAWAAGRDRPWLAAAVGAGASGVLEAGQVFLPSHTPSVTDVAVGAIGAWAGAVVAWRVRK